MKINIWITHISHRHGDDLYASTTPEEADKIVREYADEWWDQEIDVSHPKPEDPIQMVEEYFDSMDDESYQIQEAQLDLGPQPESDPAG